MTLLGTAQKLCEKNILQYKDLKMAAGQWQNHNDNLHTG